MEISCIRFRAWKLCLVFNLEYGVGLSELDDTHGAFVLRCNDHTTLELV